MENNEEIQQETEEYPTELPLADRAKIARRAGTRVQTVDSWMKRHKDFPKPVKDLQIGKVFWWPAVKDWLIKHGRKHDLDLSPDEIYSKNEREKKFPQKKAS